MYLYLFHMIFISHISLYGSIVCLVWRHFSVPVARILIFFKHNTNIYNFVDDLATDNIIMRCFGLLNKIQNPAPNQIVLILNAFKCIVKFRS